MGMARFGKDPKGFRVKAGPDTWQPAESDSNSAETDSPSVATKMEVFQTFSELGTATASWGCCSRIDEYVCFFFYTYTSAFSYPCLIDVMFYS